MRNAMILGAIAFGAGLSLPAVANATATGPAWEFTSASNSFSNGSWNFANSFTVLNTVQVSGLGWFADPNTGNVDANPVALYRCNTAGCLTTGSLLAQVVVDNTFAQQGNFRFVTIANLLLEPGDYLIGGISDSNNYTWNNVGFSVNPNLTYNDNRWFATTSGAAPTFNTTVRNDVTDGYWGPNLFLGSATFAGVPEPSIWAMMILGFGFVGGTMRTAKRRKKLAVSYA